jgi:Arc/MetJ-type ribon-helix-helix transcriptional regulator
MSDKQRLSASVDAELLAAGRRAVDEGRFDSLSSWVNEAMRLQAERDTRLRALGEFVAAYEAEHGEITEDEILDATRRARSRAVVVRAERGAA